MNLTKYFRNSLVVAGLCLGAFTSVFAQQAENTISIETDPSTFVFGGDAIHFRLSPYSWSEFRVGLGTYSMKFPDVLVNLNANNKDKGWGVDLRRGYGWFTEYYFNSANQGWFFGGQIALQQFFIEKADSKITRHYNNVLLMPYAGYRWLHHSGIYVQPWIGIGYTQKVSGSNQILEDTYDISPAMAFATIHVGYEF